MKQCPRCKQTYSDENLNFCLEDGELLTVFAYEPPASFADDPPPTVLLSEARVTNPASWPQAPPVGASVEEPPVSSAAQPRTSPSSSRTRCGPARTDCASILRVRSIRSEDEDGLFAFMRGLSDDALALRFREQRDDFREQRAADADVQMALGRKTPHTLLLPGSTLLSRIVAVGSGSR